MSVLVSFSLYAQEETSPFKFHRDNYFRHEFGLSLGLGPEFNALRHFQDFRDYSASLLLAQEYKERHDIVMFYSANGYYSYQLNDRIGVGALFGYSYGSEGIERGEWEEDMQKVGTVSSKLFYGLPFVKYTWFYFGKHLCFYSKAGIGLYHQKMHLSDIYLLPINSNRWAMAFFMSPIGLNLTQGPVRFFAEAGYGTNGIVNIGVSFHLGKVKNLHP